MTDPLRPSLPEALDEWSRRVRANNEQVERFREVEDSADFYAPVASMFRANPHRTDEPALDILRSLVEPGETWLDIGAGGGRYALPLALLAREVTAVDPSSGMLDVLRAAAAESGITNVHTIQSRWPTAEPPTADASLIAHVSYDIAGIGTFLDAMESATSRLCVAVLLQGAPSSINDALWPAVHGESRATLPSLPEFLALQLARGRVCEVRLVERPPATYADPGEVLEFARRQLWVQPGGEKDARLDAAIRAAITERDGRFSLNWTPGTLGIVTWSPR